MARELMGATDLIVGSWDNLRKHFNAYLGFIAWFVALSFAQWFLLIVTSTLIVDGILRTIVYTLAALPISLMVAVLGVGVTHMTSELLQQRAPDPRASFAEGIHKLIPFFWVSFLVGLLLFFGALLLVVPFIYLFIALTFAPLYLIVDNVRGTAAVRASRDLVTGRWWASMWRIAIPGLFFYVAAMFILALAYLIVGAFFGDPSLFFKDITSIHGFTNAQLLVTTVLPQVVHGVMLPLYAGAQILLWFDMKKGL